MSKAFILYSVFLFLPQLSWAGGGCTIDPSQNPTVADLKDINFKFNPTKDRPNQICTGSGNKCIYTKDGGKTPCEEDTDVDTGQKTETCGTDLTKQEDQDHLLDGSQIMKSGTKQKQGAIEDFAFTFAPDQNGKLIVIINPKDSNGKVEKTHSLKIEPAERMGDQTYKLDTYDGGTAKSRFPISVSAQDNGQAPSASCDQPIQLVGNGSGAVDGNGQWYPVNNGQSKDSMSTQATQHDPTVSTNTAGLASAQ